MRSCSVHPYIGPEQVSDFAATLRPRLRRRHVPTELRLECMPVRDGEEAKRVQRHVQLVRIKAPSDHAAANSFFKHGGDLTDDGPGHLPELPAFADVPAAMDVLDCDQPDEFRV